MEIKTVGDLRKIIENLDDDFKIQFRVRTLMTEDQLRQMPYPYPYDTAYFNSIEFNDIGYSDKELCLGVTMDQMDEPD